MLIGKTFPSKWILKDFAFGYVSEKVTTEIFHAHNLIAVVPKLASNVKKLLCTHFSVACFSPAQKNETQTT